MKSDMFTSILCPVDFSEYSAAALRHAAAIARHGGGQVHALYVNDPLLVGAAAIALGDRGLKETARGELVKFVADTLRTRRGSVDAVTCHVDTGKPDKVITAAVKRLRSDVIVMGTHGLSGIDQVLVGSTTARLLRRAPAPILAIPPALEVINPRSPGRSWPGPVIMTPIDLGTQAEADLREAAQIAAAFKASLLVLHVVPQPKAPPWYRGDMSAPAQLQIEKAKRQLETLTRSLAKRLEVDLRVRPGSVAEEIAVAAAAERVGLVVMRLRKGPGLFGSRAGSIAYHVLRQAITPVLALPGRG
jgi:nucleotide-binding universal stress UspA family protein